MYVCLCVYIHIHIHIHLHNMCMVQGSGFGAYGSRFMVQDLVPVLSRKQGSIMGLYKHSGKEHETATLYWGIDSGCSRG